MKVSDVMSRQADFVGPEAKVEKVALLIFGRNINTVPVCEGKKVVGIVTEKDIISRFFPTVEEYMEDIVHSSDFENMEEKGSLILSLPVKKIMSKNPTLVHPDMPLLQAQSLMSVKRISSVAVVDRNSRLVGILSKGDVFRSLIGNNLLFTENEDYNDFLSKTYYQSVDWDNRLKYELPDLLKVFEKHNVKTVLDVGCGTGDHTIALAKKGYTAIGVDRSAPMILEAKKRKIPLPGSAYSNANFYHGDAEDLIYDLKIKFDAVLFLGNTISHNLPNYRHLIKASANTLSRNGVLIFQITNFEKVLKKQNRLLNFNFATPPNQAIKEFAFVEFYDKPINHRKILKTFAILSSDGKRWKWAGIRNSLMAYTDEPRIKQIMANEGFSKTETYGGSFDGKTWDYLFRKPFNPLASDWLNVVASRK
jgi:CBS domain-containing protein/ubiquinone/menaquinone biosynthesis C-methylase UbiE